MSVPPTLHAVPGRHRQLSPVAPPDAVSAPSPVPARGSLAGLLAGLRPLCPPSLLAGAGWDRLLAGCAALPAVVAGYMGFEFRLGGGTDPAADLCAALYPGGPLAAHLAARGRGAPRGSREALLGSFAAAFTAREAPWARRAWLALLEYDCALAAQPAATPPGVFLALREPARGAAGPVADLADVVVDGLPAAVGLPPFRAARRGVDRVLGALRGGAHVSNAGVFRGRPAHTLRMVVAGLGAAGVADLLKSLSWRGPLSAVRRLLAEFGPACTAGFGLSVDITEAGIGPRAGVELFAGPPGGAWAAGSRRDWEPLVDRLVARRLCSPAKGSGLLSWPGRQRVYTAAGVRIACQGVNHVKLSFGAGPPSAKAYAGLALLPPKAGSGS